jgi:hypothetical protein
MAFLLSWSGFASYKILYDLIPQSAGGFRMIDEVAATGESRNRDALEPGHRQ